MIYKRIEEYTNGIKSFAVNNENKILISTNNDVIDFKNKIKLVNSDISFQELYYKNSNFFINNLYGKGYLFTDTFEVSFLNEYIFTVHNNFIITSKRVDEERITIIRNLKNKNEKYEIKGSSTFYYVTDEKFIRKNFEDNSIECFGFPKGDTVWKFHFTLFGKYKPDFLDEQNYEVTQIVGTYKNILWLFLNSKEFIGIDINSGELKHRISGVKRKNLIGNVDSYIDNEIYYIFYDTDYILDDCNGKIIGLKADRYFEIDLQQEHIEPILFGLWDKMKKVSLNKDDTSSKNILKENYLHFYGYNQLKFGILDIETKEIIFVSEIIDATISEYDTQQIKDMQVSNDKVYLLDSGGTLHVFEKDE